MCRCTNNFILRNQCTSLNLEATKERPNFLFASSRGFLINYAGGMLRLCRQFMSDGDKLRKVDWQFLISDESCDIFPQDETPMSPLFLIDSFPATVFNRIKTHKEFNFLTISFFLTWRSLHIGTISKVFASICYK